MIGNRFAAEELARNFQESMSKLASIKKEASKAATTERAPKVKKAEVRPEDFLVNPPEEMDIHSEDLDHKIDSVSSYAEDEVMESCADCGESMASDHSCGDKSSESEDMSYLVDRRAQEVLFELGKVARQLRKESHNFAADMVEATAIDIRKDAVNKASKKLALVSGLKKMASESYAEGDRMTGDVILVTINNIKNS